MKRIFNAIQDRLAANVPGLHYIDRDWGQLQLPQPPVQWPCCLIDIDSVDYTPLAHRNSEALATLTLTLADQHAVRSSAKAPAKTQAYDLLDLAQQVAAALDGWRVPDTTQALTRTKLAKHYSDQSYDVYTLTATTAWVEDLDEIETHATAGLTIDVGVETEHIGSRPLGQDWTDLVAAVARLTNRELDAATATNDALAAAIATVSVLDPSNADWQDLVDAVNTLSGGSLAYTVNVTTLSAAVMQQASTLQTLSGAHDTLTTQLATAQEEASVLRNFYNYVPATTGTDIPFLKRLFADSDAARRDANIAKLAIVADKPTWFMLSMQEWSYLLAYNNGARPSLPDGKYWTSYQSSTYCRYLEVANGVFTNHISGSGNGIDQLEKNSLQKVILCHIDNTNGEFRINGNDRVTFAPYPLAYDAETDRWLFSDSPDLTTGFVYPTVRDLNRTIYDYGSLHNLELWMSIL